jgi:acetyl esterase/lipase
MKRKQKLLFFWIGGLIIIACLAWLALSLLNKTAVNVQRDVQYGMAQGQPITLDIFTPPNQLAFNRPAIVFVHGGAWAAGDKRDFEDMARGLAEQGYVGFSVSYRLVMEDANQFPAQLDDVQRAVRWIRLHASEYRINPQRLCAIGGSAGGHLVSLLGTSDTRDNSDAELAPYSSRVNCVVAMYAPQDLTVPLVQGSAVDAAVIDLIGTTREENMQAFAHASPLFHIDTNTAPFLIVHGVQDPLVPLDQAERFYAALQAAGIPSDLLIFEDEGHSILRTENVNLFIKRLLAFLKTYR